jgi:hypothetical protein
MPEDMCPRRGGIPFSPDDFPLPPEGDRPVPEGAPPRPKDVPAGPEETPPSPGAACPADRISPPAEDGSPALDEVSPALEEASPVNDGALPSEGDDKGVSRLAPVVAVDASGRVVLSCAGEGLPRGEKGFSCGGESSSAGGGDGVASRLTSSGENGFASGRGTMLHTHKSTV